MAEKSNEVADNIDDYVEKISRGKGSKLDLSDEGLSVWTDALRRAVLDQLSVWIDSDFPINIVDLSDNNFDAEELAKAEGHISSDFNAPRKIILSGNPGYTSDDLPAAAGSTSPDTASAFANPAHDTSEDLPAAAGSTSSDTASAVANPAQAADAFEDAVTDEPETAACTVAPAAPPPAASASPAASLEAARKAARSNDVAANICDYVEKLSRSEGSKLDLSDEGLSLWTDALRRAVLDQLSVKIDSDFPINIVDLSDNNFDAEELAKAEGHISSDFNAPRKIILSGNPGYTSEDLPAAA